VIVPVRSPRILKHPQRRGDRRAVPEHKLLQLLHADCKSTWQASADDSLMTADCPARADLVHSRAVAATVRADPVNDDPKRVNEARSESDNGEFVTTLPG